MRGNAARLLFPALAVLALIGVVAIAATGSTSSGTSGVRPPPATLLDTIFSLEIVAVLVGAVLFLYGLTQRKVMLARGRRRRTSLGFVVFLLAFTLLAYWRLHNWRFEPGEAERAFPGPRHVPQPAGADAANAGYEPTFAWLPVGLVVGLAAAAVVAYVVAERRSRPGARDETALADDLVAAIDDTLDDLRAVSDPRRAVIAAYARLERVLAAHGMARRPAETPEEYLARVLDRLAIDGEAVCRLTDLFSRAKFSQHAVDIAMKEEAIGALEHVRDELRAAAREATPDAELATATGASA